MSPHRSIRVEKFAESDYEATYTNQKDGRIFFGWGETEREAVQHVNEEIELDLKEE